MPRKSNQLLSQGHKTTVFPPPLSQLSLPISLNGAVAPRSFAKHVLARPPFFLPAHFIYYPPTVPVTVLFRFRFNPLTLPPPLSSPLCTLCQLRLACMSLVFMTFESSARSERVPFCFENRYDMKIVKSFSFAAALWAVSDNVVPTHRCSVAAWCWCCHWCHAISFDFVHAILLRNCCVKQAKHTHTLMHDTHSHSLRHTHA